MVMPAGQTVPLGYLCGSSVTSAMRLAPSAATCRAISSTREVALVRLAAGHGDGVVVEDLVGDVDAGRGRGADGEIAGMVVGAVAEILEDVVARGERRLADPVRALAAHLGEALGAAVHPQHHVVAADAGIGAASFRHVRRGVVRAAGAEMRRARRRRPAVACTHRLRRARAASAAPRSPNPSA